MTTLDIVPYDARWLLAFTEERDRIAVARGPLVMEPRDNRPFGQRFFLLSDNDGNLLQFFQLLK
jgi:hypothetical protein